MSELETHPCFTAKCSDYARIHLPVAPKCNMQCNYCLRKYSCVNEAVPASWQGLWYRRMQSIGICR